jgi:hypothetical protein
MTLENLEVFNGLSRTAVPTGEAHRLPKKCAFLSVHAREVKAANAKTPQRKDFRARLKWRRGPMKSSPPEIERTTISHRQNRVNVSAGGAAWTKL